MAAQTPPAERYFLPGVARERPTAIAWSIAGLDNKLNLFANLILSLSVLLWELPCRPA